ncbi:hypothetical protein KZP23_12965 [Echinicola marina]|uniref:MGH1-like glycoside hydrolase domain-containing protein n=1 Tax=Echinicola marina TaxID=2859768 RepID=UPI001CF6F425|nr:trehalase family glycosidase [Echinicola marina]UCS91660.1 hypothetical protein KZP23_12965 [Echinicola marina]
MKFQKITYIILIFLVSFSGDLLAQKSRYAQPNFADLDNSHDLRLSPWGPYGKKYAGVSHIADDKRGIKFDFSVLPGFYRNRLLVPNVLFESGFFPWKANSDLTSWTYRYELEWKDKVFTDANYKVIDTNSTLLTVECENNTDLPQNIVLNLVAFLDYADYYPNVKLKHSSSSKWVNAVDYLDLKTVAKSAKDNLPPDGLRKGEFRSSNFIDASAIGHGFGKNEGDRLTYKIPNREEFSGGFLTFIFKMNKEEESDFKIEGALNKEITFIGGDGLTQLTIPLPKDIRSNSIVLISKGGAKVDLNGLLFSPSGLGDEFEILSQEKSFVPETLVDEETRQLILKYEDLDQFYGIKWETEKFRVREVKNDELDVFMRKSVHNHVGKTLWGNRKGHYQNIYLGPIELAPNSSKSVKVLISTGTKSTVEQNLRDFDFFEKKKSEKNGMKSPVLPQGEKYQFSQQLLQATLLTNVVYPVYNERSFIRHFTPGKWWNSLYTWDAGFIALGLSEIDVNRAIECINAYTTTAENPAAFIHHGSPVPVQMYAFYDLWNKTQSEELLDYFYPRLKRYYQFLAGYLGSSTTADLNSGLLKTWDYFYNSGGWDDYPAQNGVHNNGLRPLVTPVITTAQCIRVAKMLRMVALKLNNELDASIYEKDITRLSKALQKYSWNQQSGYFSYVMHDESGDPVGPFHYGGNTEYNMGLDGVYPLLSGICSNDQQEILINKIFSDKHMWTPAGITAVDQSAPYYREDGYWNGSVWMPHQWFMWKTMLDIGRPDLAFKIGEKALEVYSKETDASYYTFEHFFAKTGRGAGWHQFSGLSSPVLSWFPAYYQPGTATAGFEIWLESQKFEENDSKYQAEISFDDTTKPHPRSMLLCMNPLFKYEVIFSGKVLPFNSPYDGLLEITFPKTNKGGTLIITPVE